jgi:integrase
MARQRGSSWQGDAVVNGRRLRPAFKTKAEAEAWEGAARLADERGMAAPSVEGITGGLSFNSFVNDCFTSLWGGTANEKMNKSHINEALEYFGKTSLISSIDTSSVQKWVDVLKKNGNANSTINRKLSALSVLLNHAVKCDYLQKSPVIPRQKEGQGRVRFLTDAEEASLLTLFSRWGRDDYVAYTRFLLYTGCRPGEALSIEWRDVTGGKVTFWKTKTDVPRTIPLTSQAKDALGHGKSEGWARPFSGIKYNTYEIYWNRARNLLGFADDPHFVPYCLRHTCASRLVQRGVDIRRVKEWMGHSQITMTMRYAHLAVDDLDVAMNALEGHPKLVAIT